MDFRRTRWVCLFAGIAIELLSGIIYAWSVFQTPLIDKYGWSISQVSMAYTMCFLVVMLISMFFGAKLKQKLPIRTEILLGSVLYGGGILLMTFIRGSIWELYLYFGVIAAVGTAMIYPVLISYALELFPERTGFAGGLMTAGYGLGAVIWAPVGSLITQRTGDISMAFLVMGILFFVGIAGLSRLLRPVPAGFRESVLGEGGGAGPKQSVASLFEVGKKQMIRIPVFYLAMLSLLIGLACGSMIISQGAPILQVKFGMVPTVTALIVSCLSVTNTVGRLAWGAFSDRLGKVRTLVGIHALMGVCMLLLFLVRAPGAFIAILLCTTFCFGGAACLVAPTTEELFGGKHISENYSVTYSAFGLSSLIGPVLISGIRESTGTYDLGFLLAAGMAAAGLLVTLVIVVRTRRKKQNAAC